MTNQTGPMCAYCGNKIATDKHHLLKRSTNPGLVDEAKNLIELCRICHQRTELDQSFLEALQQIFYFWRPANVDIFQRAQASIDALLEGKEIEFLTPAMVDHYLKLAQASYSYYSDQLSKLEQLHPAFYLERKAEAEKKEEKLTEKQVQMEWAASTNGQKMIEYGRKLKTLEKLQSNMRSSLRRFETERFNIR